MKTIKLRPGKERSALRRHPWIFAGSVATLKGRARSGDTVIVEDERGAVMGRAAWSPESKIRARMWTFDPDETVDHAFFKRRVAQAVAREITRDAVKPGVDFRASLELVKSLVGAEEDLLPEVLRVMLHTG